VAGDALNAQRFLDENKKRIRRSPELGRYFIWNDAWWEEDRLDRVPAMASETIDGLREWVSEADTTDEYKRRSAHYQASAKAGRRDALLSIAGTDPSLVVAVGQLDAHPLLLACRNGTVDLTNGELRPADPDDLLTRGVDVDFNPDVRSERWEQFLDRVFCGNVDLIAFVQRLLGYCLSGVVSEHIVPVLTGSGANGKSTLVGLVQDLLGEHAISAPEGLVISRSHEPHPERLAFLRGRRLVVSAELEREAALAEALVKMLSGGDTISARELYGRRFNFVPTHKLLIVSNHRPKVRGTDHALWRRLRVVPFGAVIAPGEQDPTLRRRLLSDDGPAVLSWLVRGTVAWHRDGLGSAAAVEAATSAYRQAEDVLARWIDECTEAMDQGERTKVGDLWESWRAWAEVAREAPGRKQDFSAALEEHGVELEKRQGIRLARGIRVSVGSSEVSS
jgi:putative DNA primase/helicase